jgi:hypothetical protein
LGKTGVERSPAGRQHYPDIDRRNSEFSQSKPLSTKPHRKSMNLAKRAKDMGSAAVLFSLLNAAVVWACILWP